MASKCTACGKYLSPTSAVVCKLCPSLYHRACVGLADTGTISKDWNCSECKKKLRKGDNKSSPLKNDAVPSVVKSVDTADSGIIDLRRELAECLGEMREFRREMADFRTSVAGINTRTDVLERRLEVVEQGAATASPASGVCAKLKRTVMQLKLELNDRDQDLLQSDLEIGHLPEEKGENIVHTVTVLATKLGVTLEERDVVFAERVGVVQGAGAGGAVPRERRVVVRLARRHLRDQLLQAARVRRTLTAADAGKAANAGSRGRIFINERLTRANRLLFHRAREECRKLQWRFSWTKRGRIYVRQSEGKAAHCIKHEADFERVFGQAPV